MRRLHAFLTIAWLILCVPALLWWKNSVPFLVFISMYAIVVSHWDAYQTAKVADG